MNLGSPFIKPFAVAFGSVFAAFLIRSLLDPALGTELPFFVFYFAVMVAAFFGGYLSGSLALVGGLLVALFFFAPPRHTFSLSDASLEVGLMRYVFVCAGLTLLGGRMRSDKKELQEALEARHRAEEQARNEKDRMRATLACLSDAVIAMDPAGRITFMNHQAERLSGWMARNAEGMSLESVVNIIDARSRKPLTDLSDRALLEGHVNGDGRHALLIARDGSEHAIHESASPIVDENGRSFGSVLVFRDFAA